MGWVEASMARSSRRRIECRASSIRVHVLESERGKGSGAEDLASCLEREKETFMRYLRHEHIYEPGERLTASLRKDLIRHPTAFPTVCRHDCHDAFYHPMLCCPAHLHSTAYRRSGVETVDLGRRREPDRATGSVSGGHYGVAQSEARD